MFNETRTLERKREVPEEWQQFDLFTELFPFEEGPKEVTFPDGLVCSIDITKNPESYGDVPVVDYKVSLTLKKNNDAIYLRAYLNLQGKHNFVNTNIRRTIDVNEQRSLPEGIGVQLYTKFLDCLQKIVNSQNMTIRHEILSVPGKGMNWHKVFEPVIEKYGYKGPFSSSDEEEVYVKIYTPENKTASDS